MLEAHSERIKQNYQGAIIKGCIALENMIYWIAEYEIQKKIDEYDEKYENDPIKFVNLGVSGSYKNYFNNFSMKLGITLLLGFSCCILLNQDERIEPSLLKNVLKAISIRNRLVHSKRKGNTYFYQIYNWKKLLKYCQSLENLIEVLKPLIKKRFDHNNYI